ncbi:MAG: hypothetical protein CMJ48_08325 [Planctomycetaceae bacterium]|nr:hypothetical protein [Planctomycetaceae bacterium]
MAIWGNLGTHTLWVWSSAVILLGKGGQFGEANLGTHTLWVWSSAVILLGNGDQYMSPTASKGAGRFHQLEVPPIGHQLGTYTLCGDAFWGVGDAM